MSEGSEEHLSQDGGLSRSRADFVGSFERRLNGLRAALEDLRREPDSAARRDHLLRRVHALGASARVLGFAAGAEQLGQLEERLQGLPSGNAVAAELDRATEVMDVLPALVSRAQRGPGGAADADTAGPARPGEMSGTNADVLGPIAVLVFGSEALEVTLLAAASSTELDLERCSDPDTAFERLVAFGPDVVVVEGEHARAADFLGGLSKRGEDVQAPIVLVRSPETEEFARTLRAEGVPMGLVEGPVRGHELWMAVQQSVRTGAEPDALDELPSDFTLGDLAEHLALEVRRALLGATPPSDARVSLHIERPSEIVAQLWGALARIRETVTTMSKGSVEFAPLGPGGAVAMAPRLGESRSPGVRAHGTGVALEGRSALVVDDDPAVVWFIAGLLRAAGAQALEASDGRQGLDMALSVWPDIVISDVFMPEVDGLALCREIKRDVAVSDTPVILLSWKEDLLLRLRELGADADGYVRKEASASSILRTVRELLAPRARVEARLGSDGEVRGRLDRLTPRLILELVSERRPDACLVLRDPAYLYEVQIRGGRLRCATRTAADGAFDRDASVLAALLGVTAGRFVVTTETTRCHEDFTGTLQEVLAEPIRRARAALRATAAPMLGTLKRVQVDASVMQPYLGVMPPQAAQLLRQLIDGASPRALLVSGGVSPHVLEQVLSDAARKGALVAVEGRGGQDVLAEALEQQPDLTKAKTDRTAQAESAGADPAPAPPPAPSLASRDSSFLASSTEADRNADAPTAAVVSTVIDVTGSPSGERARFPSPRLLQPQGLRQARRGLASAAEIARPALSLEPPATGEIDEAWGSEPPGRLVFSPAAGAPGAAAGGSWSDERGTQPGLGRRAARVRIEESPPRRRVGEPDGAEEPSAPKEGPSASVSPESTLVKPRDDGRPSDVSPAKSTVETGAASAESTGTAAVAVGVDLADAVLLAMVEAGTGTPPPVVAAPEATRAQALPAAPEQTEDAGDDLEPMILGVDASGEPPSSRGRDAEKTRSLRRPIAPSLDSVRGASPAHWSAQLGPRAVAERSATPKPSPSPTPAPDSDEGGGRPGQAAPTVSAVASPPRPSPAAPVASRETTDLAPPEAATVVEETAEEAAEAEAQSEPTRKVSVRWGQQGEPLLSADEEKTPQTDELPKEDQTSSDAKAPVPDAATDTDATSGTERPSTPDPDRTASEPDSASESLANAAADAKTAVSTDGTSKASEAPKTASGGSSLLRLLGMALAAGAVSYGVVTAGTYLLGLRDSDDSQSAKGDTVPSSGVPSSGVPSSGVPSSGVPSSGVPSSGVPSSGVPSSEAADPVKPPAANRSGTPSPSVELQTLPLPPGVTVAAGQGMLEVQTGARHAIYVDGEFVGRGPSRRIPLPAGRHEVRLSLGGTEQRVAVEVAAGVRVLLPLAQNSN